jgi:hypothetical protein
MFFCPRVWSKVSGCGSRNAPTLHPDAFIFPNSDGGFMHTGNYRNRVLTPLTEKLGLPKLNFQVLRRTMATLAQRKGSVKGSKLTCGTRKPIPRPMT